MHGSVSWIGMLAVAGTGCSCLWGVPQPASSARHPLQESMLSSGAAQACTKLVSHALLLLLALYSFGPCQLTFGPAKLREAASLVMHRILPHNNASIV